MLEFPMCVRALPAPEGWSFFHILLVLFPLAEWKGVTFSSFLFTKPNLSLKKRNSLK
jgi:hypothetical protein